MERFGYNRLQLLQELLIVNKTLTFLIAGLSLSLVFNTALAQDADVHAQAEPAAVPDHDPLQPQQVPGGKPGGTAVFSWR